MTSHCSPAGDVVFRLERLDHPAVEPLLDGLAEEYRRRYGGEGGFPRVADEFRPPGAFVVAWHGDRSVGCGGFRPHAGDVAELKRLYVEPGSRGTGVAARLLATIEQHAAASGWRELWLETGLPQPEAIRLYERAGYRRIPDFGEYAGQPLVRSYGKLLR